jgi:hypothetical protein
MNPPQFSHVDITTIDVVLKKNFLFTKENKYPFSDCGKLTKPAIPIEQKNFTTIIPIKYFINS